jgi:hypothetical protein
MRKQLPQHDADSTPEQHSRQAKGKNAPTGLRNMPMNCPYPNATPLGLVDVRRSTQGSGVAATLGYGTESRWDSMRIVSFKGRGKTFFPGA